MQFEKVALFTGAGAIQNAWDPIIRVLKPDYHFDFDIDSANSFLALMVYQLRYVALEESPQSKTYLMQMIKDHRLIKQELCRSLIFAEKHNEIAIRNEFFSILNKYIFHKNVESIQVTTNWDTVVDNALNYYGHSTTGGSIGKISLFHLHGSVQSPETLYLPSEITKEPYRSKEESLNMIENHASLLHALYECNRTILYGLSLDPLDAELSQVLSSGWNSPNTKEIIIINPDHKRVAKRVKLLLNDFEWQINIVAYSPENLDYKIQY